MGDHAGERALEDAEVGGCLGGERPQRVRRQLLGLLAREGAEEDEPRGEVGGLHGHGQPPFEAVAQAVGEG